MLMKNDPTPYPGTAFDHAPMVVFYEVTRACDLVCRHCRACAQPRRHPKELNERQARMLIRQLTEFDPPPLLVITGGDPLKREDVERLVGFAVEAGLKVAMTPSATPLVTGAVLHRLREVGLRRLAVSLDGADAATHDRLRGIEGSFDRTLRIIHDAHAAGLPVQINTTISSRNSTQIDAMAEMLGPLDIAMWSVFFLVPVGRGLAEQRISPAEYERVFERLWHHARHQPYLVKTTEAQHYRRYVLQRGGDPRLGGPGSPLGVNDGKGVMFISHTGQIFPSGFLPIECGRFPDDSLLNVYRGSAVMRMLRDPDRLKGKCGACEFQEVCGGSRARAYAVTRDPMAEEPDCLYTPAAWRKEPA